MVHIKSFACGPAETNTYVVSNTTVNKSFVVDVPPGSMAHIVNEVESHGCEVETILLTHTHWDHTVDVADLQEKTRAKVLVHADDAYRLLDQKKHTIWNLPFDIKNVVPDAYVQHGDELNICGLKISVLHTPGHTEGGVCFFVEDHQMVFVGDTLFQRSVGRTDLPGGDMEELVNSIQSRLFTLPGDTMVYPGHGAPTTIADEMRSNPFVGALK